MEKQSTAITVSKLQKSYKKVTVLRDVSFSVQKGTIFALLGSNGAGKTTIINILTTLLNADSGTAMVHSFNVESQPEKVRNHISLTGQFAAVDDVLTARENLVLIGELRHASDPARTAEALLKQFDLTDAADRRTLTFSGGMSRRLDIAMSLIGSPSIIFFDEPTTGLDPQSRNSMWETIKSLAKSGTTVFLTTQYLEEADQLADKIAILHQGKIAVEGTADELKKLLPRGQVELRFYTKKQLDTAATLLKDYELAQTNETLSLIVTTGDGVAQLTRLLAQLEAANIEIAEFAQKVPTLDDVFLKIINENEETK
ncbi:MAG TPA: ATP-binding cassette domain-containing protein [Candidatus Saccharimonadales bacterium]|nr:ATP-binding cassette domain-containing protein [Candidatus Saccharimonadales bacterium]